MKVIIAGSRTVESYALLLEAISEAGVVITEVISGTARGADRLGERWALENNIPLRTFPAHWEVEGKAAGYRRNERMARYAAQHQGGLIALWDGESRGTKHMIEAATAHGLAVYVKEVK